MIKVGILGIQGRMGQALVRSVSENTGTELVGGLVKKHDDCNIQADYFITDDMNVICERSDVLIDFSHIESLPEHLDIAYKFGKPIVIGTTGFDTEIYHHMIKISKNIPVLQSGNMSLGVNILCKLVKQTSSLLGDDWDIEITEAHHREKIDAPSGTALMLGHAAADGRKQEFDAIKVFNRSEYKQKRSKGDIGFSVIRSGSIIGEHQVMFGHLDETLILSHQAHDRKIFANGAVYAATRLVHKPAGFYSMVDVLPI